MSQAALVKQVAPIKYAQRKDSIYLTIDLPDLTEESISLTADKVWNQFRLRYIVMRTWS